MTTYRKYPADESEIFLREQIGEDGEAAPKLHGKMDNTKAAADSAVTGIGNVNTKLGTPAGASVSADIAAIQSDADAIEAELANATYGLAALKAETDGIDTAISDLSTKIGAPAGATIAADIAAVQSAVEGLQNDTSFSAYVPQQLERPKTGDPAIEYQILVDHKDNLGNMEDFDANPTVALANVAGTDRSAYLYNAAGTQTATMDKDATGQYSLRIRINAATTIENLLVTIHGVEDTKDRYKRIPCRVDESFSDHFNTADRQDLQDAKLAAENVEAAVGTPTTGTVASHVEATETLLGTVDGKIDIIDGNVDDIEADLLTMRQKTSGTFDRDTDSLEALSEKLDVIGGGANPGIAIKTSGAIAQGGFEEVVLGPSEGFHAQNAELFQIKVRPTTNTSTNFRVRVYERTGQSGTDYLVGEWQKIKATNEQGGLWSTFGGDLFANQDIAPGQALYVRIDNVTDSATSAFVVEQRYKTLGALAS